MPANQFANNASTQSQAGASKVDIAMPSFGSEAMVKASEGFADNLMKGVGMINDGINNALNRKQDGRIADMNEAGQQSRHKDNLLMKQTEMNAAAQKERAKQLAEAEKAKQEKLVSEGAVMFATDADKLLSTQGYTKENISVIQEGLSKSPEKMVWLEKNSPDLFKKLTNSDEMQYNSFKEFNSRVELQEKSGIPMSDEQRNLLRAEYPDLPPGVITKFNDRYRKEKREDYSEDLKIAQTEQKGVNDAIRIELQQQQQLEKTLNKAHTENSDLVSVFGLNLRDGSASALHQSQKIMQNSYKVNPDLQKKVNSAFGVTYDGAGIAEILGADNPAFKIAATSDLTRLDSLSRVTSNLIAESGADISSATRGLLKQNGIDEKHPQYKKKYAEYFSVLMNPDKLVKNRKYTDLDDQEIVMYSYAMQVRNNKSGVGNVSLTYWSPTTSAAAHRQYRQNQEVLGYPTGGKSNEMTRLAQAEGGINEKEQTRAGITMHDNAAILKKFGIETWDQFKAASPETVQKIVAARVNEDKWAVKALANKAQVDVSDPHVMEQLVDAHFNGGPGMARDVLKFFKENGGDIVAARKQAYDNLRGRKNRYGTDMNSQMKGFYNRIDGIAKPFKGS